MAAQHICFKLDARERTFLIQTLTLGDNLIRKLDRGLPERYEIKARTGVCFEQQVLQTRQNLQLLGRRVDQDP